ncbi:VOC family protein [Nakamurella sp. A5-74]|uniref:VOC family protein n=1 Tax=Nakamurella sp. A5-74 TaxID=3158264 RepID=A0AAU8DMI3_9ACTN
MTLKISGYAHVRLTVTDIDVSRKFYDDVFGLPIAMELPADADDQTREQLAFLFGGVIYQLPNGSLMGLRPVAPAGSRFDEDNVGMDHLSFWVDSTAQLDESIKTLDALGVAHGGIKDGGAALFLEFRDPDNIALELWAPKS